MDASDKMLTTSQLAPLLFKLARRQALQSPGMLNYKTGLKGQMLTIFYRYCYHEYEPKRCRDMP